MDVIRLLQDLVRIPSVNNKYAVAGDGNGGEKPLAEHLGGLLKAAGFSVELPEVLPGRPNVLAHRGKAGAKAVAFCSHMDTMSSAGMEGPAFEAPIRDGCLWGRGSCDTKGSLAAMVAAAVEEPAANVLLVLTCDEESGMRGIQHFLAHNKLPLAGAVVGEPTGCRLGVAHKGVYRTTVTAEGRAAHSSTPHLGINAIYRLAPAVLRLEALAKELETRPPHPRLDLPTLSVGTIHGGAAVNSVPDSCVLEMDRRLLPEESIGQAEEEIRAALSGCEGVAVGMPTFECPALSIDPGHPWAAAVAAAVGDSSPIALAYGTDGAFCQKAGIPTVVYGPGEPRLAHAKDEHIHVADVQKALAAYRAILRSAATG